MDVYLGMAVSEIGYSEPHLLVGCLYETSFAFHLISVSGTNLVGRLESRPYAALLFAMTQASFGYLVDMHE